MERRQRRSFSPQMKADVLKKVLREKQAVSSVCSQHDIGVTQFYQWQNDLFERMPRVFEDTGDGGAKSAKAEVDAMKVCEYLRASCFSS
jgi:transposase-like protein